MEALSLKKQCAKRWDALKIERSSWIPHWQEISEVLLPRAGRFLVTENNRGDKRHRAILDNSGTRALRTLAGGMMAGMTSPARPWFRLSTSDPGLDESYEVKKWMTQVTTLMQMIFNRSNVYRALQMTYEELGAFGTSAVVLLDDYENVIHCMPLTIGEYALATDSRGNVDTLYREFRMTVAAVAEEFGYEKCSRQTKTLYDKGCYDEWVTVINAIEPRRDRDARKLDNRNMPFRSVYFEDGAERDNILRETGFRQFPALCPRWNVTGGDIYGCGPGMEALGDLRQLQQEQFYKSKALALMADPPVIASADLRNQEANLVPGGVVYADNVAQVQGIRAAYEVNLRPDVLAQDLLDIRQRINEAFYKDIFMMISGMPNTQRATATEIAERHEEKMLMLGPVLERLNAEMNDRLIAMTFDRMVRLSLLPPVPPEMDGRDINVEFVSILAQAQRAVSTNAIDRFTQNLGQLVAIKPELADKFNSDYWADSYSDLLGIDPQLVVSGDQVALIRQARTEMQQQQARMEQASQMAGVAKDLAQAQPLQGDLRSATSAELFGQYSGY